MTQKIQIYFQIDGDDDDGISIECKPNKPIGSYRKKLQKDSKYKNYVFKDENGAFIDDDTCCNELKSKNIVLCPNGNYPITIDICNNKNSNSLDQIKPQLKFSSLVSDVKQKILKEKWKSKPIELNQNDIQLLIKDNVLSDDEHIFSYKKTDKFVVKAIIPEQVDETPLKYFFQFPNEEKARTIEINPNLTFIQINEMEEFNDQEYMFYVNGEKIDKESKINDIDAQNDETPIQLKINYLIQLGQEGSKSKPKESYHAFSSNQQIKEVLDELVSVGKERRKLFYDKKQYNEDSKLSKINYQKGIPLIITILPVEYTFRFEDEDNTEFKMSISSDMTVKEVIKLIQKKKKIDNDLEIYTGGESEPEMHEPNEQMSIFHESDIITIKKLDPLYKITFNDLQKEKRFPVEYTVEDLLKSDKKYKSPNKRQKIVAKNKDIILENDEKLSNLSSKDITIELSEPNYQFQLEDSEPIELSIPDDTNYEHAISIVKKNIKKLKKIVNDRIEFVLEGYEFNMDTLFGPDIPDNGPIIIKINDPSYNWLVKENKGDKGVEKVFTFPENFSIVDAVKQIEESFKYKCGIKIVKTDRGRNEEISEETNLYDELYDDNDICVIKGPVTFTFEVNEAEYTKTFDVNSAIVAISKYLRYDEKKKSLDFGKPSSYFELEDRLEFKYKGNVLKHSDTFDSLDYNPYENETISIKLLPPKYNIYSLEFYESRQCKGNILEIDDIKIPEENYILYNNFNLIDQEIKVDNYTTIDYFAYETKVDFEFSIDAEIEKYSTYINDNDITIDEIKALVAAHIAKFQDRNYGPERICLKYKKKEITQEFFKDISYNEGKSIDVSIKNCIYRVKISNDIQEIELDDDNMTVKDLKSKIENKKRYIIKYRNKILEDTQNLKKLHLTKEDYIDAEIVQTKVLLCNGKEYELDNLDLDDKNKLRKHFQCVFNIDVDNSTFTVGKKEIELKDFENLPKGAKVEVETKSKKFKRFEDTDYNNIFKTDQSISDVRKYIYEEDGEDKLPIRFKSGEKFLLDKTKLFQVEGNIKIEKIKDKYCKKILEYPEDLEINDPVTEYFDCDTTGEELKAYIMSYVPDDYLFDLMFEDSKIEDDTIICEFGDEIRIVPSVEEDGPNDKVDFTILKNIKKKNKNVTQTLLYSNDKEIAKYAEKLKLKEDDGDYIFFERGKLLLRDDQVKFYKDVETQIVYVLPYKETTDDDFDCSANCVKRVEKPQLKINEIIVNEVTVADTPDFENGQVKIKYEPMSILDLRKKVAIKLGFKKEAEIDFISLFIPFQSRDVTEFALLSDDEDVAEVLTENSSHSIHYKIIKNTARIKRTRNYRDYASNSGLSLNDEQIHDIFRRVDGNSNMLLSTIDYMISKE